MNVGMNNSVCIIIPTLNEERFIADCLDSVFRQSYPSDRMDILIVDGGSRDRTRAIVSEIASKYPNVRLIDNPYRIQSVAFNIGVKNSSAPIVIRLDAHAWYDSEYVSLCVRHLLENERYGNVGGRCEIESQRKTVASEANAVLNRMKFGIGGADFRTGDSAGIVDTVPFGAFRREVLQRVGPMNERLARGEDNEFNARISEAGYFIYFDPAIKCRYYARPTFTSSVKQMYANGLSIGNLLVNFPRAVGLRHLIPVLFVLSLVGFSLLSLFFPVIGWLLVVELILYWALNVVSSIYAGRRCGWRVAMVLPVLIFAVHCAYGLGTVVGIFKSIR